MLWVDDGIKCRMKDWSKKCGKCRKYGTFLWGIHLEITTTVIWKHQCKCVEANNAVHVHWNNFNPCSI